MDGTLTDTTTPFQSRPEINSIEEVLHIPKSSRTGASPSDILVLYPKHLGSYSSAEVLWIELLNFGARKIDTGFESVVLMV